MKLHEALLDSWERQATIVNEVAGLVDESNRKFLATADGWPIDHQLAHMHGTRRYFLNNTVPEVGNALPSSLTENWEPISDLSTIKSCLHQSGRAIHEQMAHLLCGEMEPIGWYDNPVLFLQHMVWHEGWHVGSILTAMRVNGHEVPEEWEDEHVWGRWRTEVWEG